MPDYNIRFTPETMRTRSGASLTNAYQTLGSAITHASRQMVLVNGSGVIVYISWDGTNDHLPLLAGSSVVLDMTSNAVSNAELSTPAGKQLYVRAPANVAGTDNVYLSTFYAS